MVKNIFSWLAEHKKGIGLNLIRLGLLVGLIIGFLWWRGAHKPRVVPPEVRPKISYRVLYPDTKKYQINPTSWKVVDNDKNPTLSFEVNLNGNKVVFTEQKAPLAYVSDQAAYQRFVGTLRPQANFDTPNGNVSIVNFITAGDYKPAGKSAVLLSNKTLIIAHPDQPLDDTAWYDLMQSLKVE